MAIYNYSEVDADENGFTFKTIPTKQQTEKFEYVAFNYLSDNPGPVSNEFSSIVGIYYEPTTGETT